MSSGKKSSRKSKGKAPSPSPQTPGEDVARQHWLDSLTADSPFAGMPPSQQTPPTQRYSPFFETTPQQLNPPYPIADDVYRPGLTFGQPSPRALFDTPGSTPGTEQSQSMPFAADQDISTSDYEVDETAPEPATEQASGSRKSKGKEKAQPSTASEGKPKRTRTTYTLAESALIASCWVDTSEDPQLSNYQTEIKFWQTVAEKYHRNKTPMMTDHGSEAIRRHWERILKECGGFNGIYQNLVNNMPSGYNDAMVRDEAISRWCGKNLKTSFKYWDVYQRLKDIPKFQTGMQAQLQGRSQRTRLSSGGSHGSAEPIDLTSDGPVQRPPGRRTARRNRGGASSQATEVQSPAVDVSTASLSNDQTSLTQMMMLYWSGKGTEQERALLWRSICSLEASIEQRRSGGGQ